MCSAQLRRVSVVGTSGSGKSTLGAALASRLGAEFLELDSVFHQPGWVPLPREEFRERVAAAVAGDRWVIDGNYTSQVKDLVWAHADTVVWLDLPRRTVMRRIIWRSFRRALGRTELWNGNRERWRNFFSLDKGVRHRLGVADARRDPGQAGGGHGRSGEQPPPLRSA